jgi:cation diffusion facilitator family transporter
LYADGESLIESVKSILDPKKPVYTTWGLALISTTIIAKFALGYWTEKRGDTLQSNALIASGKDSRMDSLVTLSTVVSALLFIFFKIHLSGWLGLIISFLIIKSGVEILNDSISKLLGERVSATLSKQIKETIAQIPGVKGVYNLVLSNYGPNTIIGSVHIEVNDTMSMNELDTLERNIANQVYERYNIFLTGIGIYTKNTENTFVQSIQTKIRQKIVQDPLIKNMHGFYIDPSKKKIQFDVVLDFKEKDANKKRNEISKQVKTLFPDYFINVTIDREISD